MYTKNCDSLFSSADGSFVKFAGLNSQNLNEDELLHYLSTQFLCEFIKRLDPTQGFNI